MPVDTSQFEDRGLDEQPFHTYKCSVCGDTVQVAVEYDNGQFYPVDEQDTVCKRDFTSMDME